MSQDFQVQCRGLPWETTESELRDFFGNSGIASIDIPRRNGRASGDATVAFTNESDYKDALKKDREHLGARYIEVFPMDSAPRRRGDRPERDDFRGGSRGGPPRDRYGGDRFGDRRSGGSGGGSSGPDSVVRLRGLPFSVTIRDITDFLAPLPIVRDGVLLPDQQRARPGGEAYVCFETTESVQIAKQRHMKNIGHRYIEVFESSFRELSRFADENGLRVPRFGPQPFVSGPPAPPRGGYDPYESNYRREQPYREPEDPYGRPRDSGYGQRPYDGYQAPPAQNPYQSAPAAPAAAPAPGSGYGYDAYNTAKPYDSYGRDRDPRDPAPRERDMGMAARDRDPRGGAPLDPYTGKERYPEYGGSSAPVGGASSGNGYDYWRGGSSVGGGGAQTAPSAARDPYLGDSWASGGGAPQDRDRYGGGGYPNEPYQQREAGGAMRRPDYGRPDDRQPPRQDPYGGYGRDRPDYGRPSGPSSGQQFILRMRGIPFRATEADVHDFFRPARPDQVDILKDAYQRLTGDARVVFYNRKDYDDALMKDKQYMGERYIEIIPDNGRY